KFPHLLVVGIARNPQSVKRRINKKKFIKKTGVKPFLKNVNQNHVMPTRFVVNDFELKDLKEESGKNTEAKGPILKAVRKQFSEAYRNLPAAKDSDKAAHTRFFFSRLRF
ncbi:UNVERIFIED_CONTAM: hypothetical protein GTU68_002001, partial [Idotea baltica]|nr:hypothetical protein [Idotea baltica]